MTYEEHYRESEHLRGEHRGAPAKGCTLCASIAEAKERAAAKIRREARALLLAGGATAKDADEFFERMDDHVARIRAGRTAMRWRTDHTLAWCPHCEWHQRAERVDPPAAHAEVVRAGRRHEDGTGHGVIFERGQTGG